MKKFIIAVLLGSAMAAHAGMSAQCEAYFKAVDEYVAKAPDAVKQQMEMSKKQIEKVPAQAQEMHCKQALDLLKQMPKM